MNHPFSAMLAALATLVAAPAWAEATPAAVIADVPRDAAHPADLAAFQIDVAGSKINAVLYLAAGDKPHPTLLFLHGFPGNETNVDVMQAARRAGWNVLRINYRGSWGSGGDFSFANARVDARTAAAFLFDPANVAKYRIDPKRVVVAGHSMGGFMAADAAAAEPRILGAVLIDAWDIGLVKREIATPAARQAVIEGLRPDTAPLSGTSPETLVAEIERDAGQLNLAALTERIAGRPLLLIGAKFGNEAETRTIAGAARAAKADQLNEIYLPTDHSFSDARIALSSTVVGWLRAR